MRDSRWKYLVPMVMAFGIMSIAVLTTAASPENRPACDIQQAPCVAHTVDNTRIELDILPRPIRAMTDLTFVVSLSKNGKPIADALIQIDLTMPGMSMGKNQVRLKMVSNGRYEGQGIITRCMSGRKNWKAE